MRHLFSICLLFALAGCSFGSTTTLRPALSRPVVGPDGSFWDAADAAARRDNDALRRLLTVRFIHEALLPAQSRNEPDSTAAYDRERQRLSEQLQVHEVAVARLLEAYAERLRQLTENRFVEVGRPEYEIKYRDDFDRANGPNRAFVVVQCWQKGALSPDAKPETIRITFVQDRERWLIDDFEPNALKGAFTR